MALWWGACYLELRLSHEGSAVDVIAFKLGWHSTLLIDLPKISSCKHKNGLALEQVRNKRPGSFPDLLVPFGRSGGAISDYGLNASGGAFRSKSNWYNIDFKCTVDSSRSKVVTFSFTIGGAVPRSDWNARRLIID